jgi:hypothetical protein
MTPGLALADWAQLAAAGPMLVIYYIFFILALYRWRRHPRASLLTVVGTAILGVTDIGWHLYRWLFLVWLSTSWAKYWEISNDFGVGGFIAFVFDLIGMCLILSAVFVDRGMPAKLSRFDDPYAPLPEE